MKPKTKMLTIGILLMLCGLALAVVETVKDYEPEKVKPPLRTQIVSPKNKQIKIEHTVTERNGIKQDHWYTYQWTDKPGWVIIQSHDSLREAQQWRDILNEVNSEPNYLLREEVP